MSKAKDLNEPKVEQIDPDAATFKVTIPKKENDIVQNLWLKVEEVIDVEE